MIPIRHGSKKNQSISQHHCIDIIKSGLKIVFCCICTVPAFAIYAKINGKITTMTSVHITIFSALISKIHI